MFAELLAWDRAAFLQLNAPRGEAWDLLFGYGTYLGDGLVLAVILFIVTKLFDGRRFPKNFLLIGIAMLFAGALNGIVKNAFDRPRPLNEPAFAPVKAERVETALGPWLTRHEYRAAPGGEGGLRVLGKRYGRRSFPSGHTAAAFAFAAGMIYAYRFAWTWLVLLPAAFVGLSRIVCGVHFPIDVFGGALIGASVSAGFLRAFEMFHGLGGKIHPRAPHRDDGPPRVMMVVGEASADVYGARILAAMRAKEPGVSAFGVGGEQLENAGLERVADAHDLSIVGFTAVLTSLGAIVRIYRRLMRLFETRRPDLLVCIDLPDFNLMLAQQARFRGVPVLYFISPQFWAWRAGRVRKIARRLSRMIVAFPFEIPFYEKEGVSVAFHGHPLLEVLERRFASKDDAKRHFGLDPDKKTLVLAPGSRGNEFKYVRPAMFEAARRVLDAVPGWQAAVPVAPRADLNAMCAAAKRAGIDPVFTRGDNNDLFGAADFGILCSGTATLEAALAGLPMVIVYRGHPLNIFIAKRMVNIDRIGLPNIILGGETPTFPELIQRDADAASLADRVITILSAPGECDRLRDACREVKARLAGGRTSEAVAEEALRLAARE